MINKICENCHKMFLAKGWKYKTCSRNCDCQLRAKKKFIKNIHCCDNCKKIFSDKRINKNKFCSLKCSSECDVLNRFGYGIDNRLEKECKGCKKILPNNKEYFYLEKQFTKDMTWKAFRDGDIHIDHIKPQSLFNLKDIKDIKECWSLNNLQPLWAKDNIIKSNKYKEK